MTIMIPIYNSHKKQDENVHHGPTRVVVDDDDAKPWSAISSNDGTADGRLGNNGSLEAVVVAATASARSMVRRSSSVIWEERPQTPTGWALFLMGVASIMVGYELQLQQQLTCPPLVFLQQSSQ